MLIITGTVDQFDTNAIKRGTLIWAKHKTWKQAEAGFVITALPNEVIVQYPPQIGNVTNHFFIPVKEAAAGDWEIRFTNDVKQVYEYPEGVGNDTERADS